MAMMLVGVALGMHTPVSCRVGIAVHQTIRCYSEWWRAMLLICVMPWFVWLAAMMLTLPASMHWLLVGGRFQEAREQLKDLDSAKGIELVAEMVRWYSGRRLNGWNYTASALIFAGPRGGHCRLCRMARLLILSSPLSQASGLSSSCSKTATKLHVPRTSFLCIYSCCVTNHNESPVLACVLASVP